MQLRTAVLQGGGLSSVGFNEFLNQIKALHEKTKDLNNVVILKLLVSLLENMINSYNSILGVTKDFMEFDEEFFKYIDKLDYIKKFEKHTRSLFFNRMPFILNTVSEYIGNLDKCHPSAVWSKPLTSGFTECFPELDSNSEEDYDAWNMYLDYNVLVQVLFKAYKISDYKSLLPTIKELIEAEIKLLQDEKELDAFKEMDLINLKNLLKKLNTVLLRSDQAEEAEANQAILTAKAAFQKAFKDRKSHWEYISEKEPEQKKALLDDKHFSDNVALNYFFKDLIDTLSKEANPNQKIGVLSDKHFPLWYKKYINEEKKKLERELKILRPILSVEEGDNRVQIDKKGLEETKKIFMNALEIK